MGNFVTYFSQFLVKAKERLQQDQRETSIASVVKAKKQEIEQLHLELLERIMKKLSDEKKAVWQSLDLMEKEYREKESVLLKNHQQRLEIINYLLPYAESSELLELKLKTSSGWGLTRLKEYLTDLERLTNSFDSNCLIALESSAAIEAGQKLDGTLFKSLSKLLKEQPVLIRPPLP
jgi:DNA primase catalytic subunit